MIELTDQMRERLAGALMEGYPVVAATVGPDGQPKLSFYGSAHVHSPDELAVWVRDPNAGLLSRIASNPHMALMYRNIKERVGWQFFGRARVVDDPDARAAVYDAIPLVEQKLDSERNGVAVVIDLDRVTGGGVDMTRA